MYSGLKQFGHLGHLFEDLLTMAAGRVLLSANTNYYISTSGSDTTGDGSAANPWATPQHVSDYLTSTVDFGGQTVDVHCADGTYAGVDLGGFIGGGKLIWHGHAGTSLVIFQSGAFGPSVTGYNPSTTIVQFNDISFRPQNDASGPAFTPSSCIDIEADIEVGFFTDSPNTNGCDFTPRSGYVFVYFGPGATYFDTTVTASCTITINDPGNDYISVFYATNLALMFKSSSYVIKGTRNLSGGFQQAIANASVYEYALAGPYSTTGTITGRHAYAVDGGVIYFPYLSGDPRGFYPGSVLNGNVGLEGFIGSSTIGINALGQTTVLDTTNSTNSASGALIVDGGIGVVKDINFDGELMSSITSGPVLVLNATGAHFGNIGVSGSQQWQLGHSASNATLGTASLTWDASGIITIPGTTTSTSPTTGTLVVSGGLGVAGKVNFGASGLADPFYVLGIGTTGYISSYESTAANNFNRFISTGGSGEFGIWNDAFYFQALDTLSGGIQLIQGSSGATQNTGNNIILVPHQTGIVDQVDSTNAQRHNIYNTYTNSSNWERAGLDWQTTANTIRIRSEAAGTGTVRIIAIDGFQKAGAPAAGDLPSGSWGLIHDTSGATFNLCYNDAGTLKKVALV